MAKRKPSRKRVDKGGGRLSPLTITLDESDFEGFGEPGGIFLLGEGESRAVGEMGDEEKERMVRRFLPKAVARKIAGLIPDEFELSEISFTGEVSGMPFGIGVSGQVSVVFTKAKATN